MDDDAGADLADVLEDCEQIPAMSVTRSLLSFSHSESTFASQ